MIPAEQWTAAWCDHESTTIQQAERAEADVVKWLAGEPHAAFDPFKALVGQIGKKNGFSLAEIGTGAGYYLPVFHSFVKGGIYYGVDISQRMVDYARQKYGDIDGSIFRTADSAALPYADESIDCVCISGLIQHLANYVPSIREARRVAKRHVILHRVEATTQDDHEFVRKAYDAEIPTRKVNEDRLHLFCGMEKLRLERTLRWSESGSHWSASYLFTKVK